MLRVMQDTAKRHLYQGKSIGFVPTMGALHEGHLSLVKRARSECDIVVVSIFVNPLQFGQGEDFERYPRDSEGDREKLLRARADILFAPDAAAQYPESFSTHVTVSALSERLCGAFRPGHFSGVTTVVCKLFHIVRPVSAYFGQKDYQQTVIIKRMVEDLNMGVEVVVVPTVREPDGLALSSRNAYLSPAERKAAPVLYRTLLAASQEVKAQAAPPVEIKARMHAALLQESLISEVQYAGVYDPATLEEATEFGKRTLLALAVKMGSTRLIDNLLVDR